MMSMCDMGIGVVNPPQEAVLVLYSPVRVGHHLHVLRTRQHTHSSLQQFTLVYGVYLLVVVVIVTTCSKWKVAIFSWMYPWCHPGLGRTSIDDPFRVLLCISTYRLIVAGH